MAVLYIAAGIYHFIRPVFYKKIMPHWLPYHLPLIYISGLAEIALGTLLFFDGARIIAAWGIIVLLIAVFPANIQMMLNYKQRNHPYTWLTILRLPLQLLLMWWAWSYTF